MQKNEELVKEAAFGRAGLAHMLEIAGHTLKAIPGSGMLGAGLGVIAQKTGAGLAISLTKTELDRIFEEIIRRNPEYASRRGVIRQYFDVITKHSPEVAKDIVTTEGLIKNMDTFGGVSLDTIKQLSEIQNKKSQYSSGVTPFRF